MIARSAPRPPLPMPFWLKVMSGTDALRWLARQSRTTVVGIYSPRVLMGTLVCGPHGHSLRRLVCSTGTDFKGLEQAARQCRRSGLISSRIARKLLALDAAYQRLSARELC